MFLCHEDKENEKFYLKEKWLLGDEEYVLESCFSGTHYVFIFLSILMIVLFYTTYLQVYPLT